MFKYYTVLIGLATMFGTLRLFLDGTSFYVGCTLSVFLALWTVVAWQQSERVMRLRAIMYPFLMILSKHMGAEIVPLFVETARRPRMEKEVVSILIDMLRVKPDPTERYWIYIALGQIGSRRSKLAVKQGLSDENEFARGGAKVAWRLMKNSNQRRTQ